MTDQSPDIPASGDSPAQGGMRWTWQFTVAVALLIGFVTLVIVMLYMSDVPNETVWQRRVYIFGAAEAIVFTAVGWIFGREVNRAAVQTVKEQADVAKQDAETAREDARQQSDAASEAKQDAAAERARSDVVSSVMKHARPAASTRQSGVAQDSGIGSSGTEQPAGMVVDLPSFLRDVYPR